MMQSGPMSIDLVMTIRTRLASSATKLAKLRAQMDALAQETAEYETALKVLEQVTTVASAQGNAHGQSTAAARAATEGPTMPDLILSALEDGPKPIAGVTALVTTASGKPTDANNIRSTAWRMWKANRISKTGDVYHLNSHKLEAQPDNFEDLLT